MSREPLPLFVFGTLRRGECNHHYLAGRYARVLAARLFDYTLVAPLMIDRSPGASVAGELFFPLPGCYDAVLQNCDELEGVTPRLRNCPISGVKRPFDSGTQARCFWV